MWLVFTIITTLLWGLGELFYKKGNHAREKYSHLKTSIFVGIVMGIHAIIILLTQDISFDPYNIIVYIPVSLCYIVSMTCSYFGVRFIEESIADPIENTSGAIVPILCAVILHQHIQAWSIVAIIVIVVGVLGVGFLENKGSTDRKKRLGKKLAIFAFAMPFCYALLDATGTFLDIYYLDIETTFLVNVTEDTIENVANTCYELTFLFLAIGMLIFLAIKKVKLFSIEKQPVVNEDGTIVESVEGEVVEAQTEKLGFFKRILVQKDKIIAAVCETAGQFTYVYALSSNGSIASPIIGAGCVIVSLLLSRIFLKEKLTKLQYVFILCVLVGIIILSIVEGD